MDLPQKYKSSKTHAATSTNDICREGVVPLQATDDDVSTRLPQPPTQQRKTHFSLCMETVALLS